MHDFAELFACYPPIIDQMPDRFTAHEFILQLARQNQRLYVEALYSYRQGAPFQAVHQQLATMLNQCPQVVSDGNEPNSRDIWTNRQGCSRWRKV